MREFKECKPKTKCGIGISGEKKHTDIDGPTCASDRSVVGQRTQGNSLVEKLWNLKGVVSFEIRSGN